MGFGNRDVEKVYGIPFQDSRTDESMVAGWKTLPLVVFECW
jgi:hypothetical protein